MADELPGHPINQPPVPSVYFSQLPDEVIDLIFMYCNRFTAHPENNVFVRSNTLCKNLYVPYIMNMQVICLLAFPVAGEQCIADPVI